MRVAQGAVDGTTDLAAFEFLFLRCLAGGGAVFGFFACAGGGFFGDGFVGVGVGEGGVDEACLFEGYVLTRVFLWGGDGAVRVCGGGGCHAGV